MRSFCVLAVLAAMISVAGVARAASPFTMHVTGAGTYGADTKLGVSAKADEHGFSGHVDLKQDGEHYRGDVSQGCMLTVGNFAIVVGQVEPDLYLAAYVYDTKHAQQSGPDRANAALLPTDAAQALCAAVLAGPIVTVPLDSGNFEVKGG